MLKTRTMYFCDFCGKRQDESEVIVAGSNGAAICSDCVGIALDVIKDWRSRHPSSTKENARAATLSMGPVLARAAAADEDSERGGRRE